MPFMARICAAAFVAILPACIAQTPQHKKKSNPKPAPTAQELFEMIRGALLSYSPDDAINDNLEVTFDPASSVLTITQPDGHCDQFLNALDADTLVWDIFDASDSVTSRQQILRLNVVSQSGKTARTCYDNENRIDEKASTNRARFLFSLTKTEDIYDFRSRIEKALKKLIVMSSESPETRPPPG